MKLKEPTLKELKHALDQIPDIYNDTTIRCLSNCSYITGLELNLGEWVIWIHTYGDDEE